MYYGTLLLLKVKIIFEYSFNSLQVQVPNLLIACFAFAARVIAAYYMKTCNKTREWPRDSIRLSGIFTFTRACFLVFLALTYMPAFFGGDREITLFLSFFSAVLGVTSYVREALFCIVAYIFYDALYFAVELKTGCVFDIRREIYLRSILWIAYSLFAYSMERQSQKLNETEFLETHYYNVADKIMTYVKRPFVVCDKFNLNFPIYNLSMKKLVKEYNYSSFNELASALQVQSKVVLRQSPRSYKRQHILHQYQPHSYNPSITLKEFIEEQICKSENIEIENRLDCILRTEAGCEQFYVNICANSLRNEISVFVQKRSMSELTKRRRDQNKARNLLLKTLSHNIRNPLAAIMYIINQITADEKMKENEGDKVKKLKNIVELMHIKVEDLLDFALILEGEFILKRELVNIGELLQELKELLKQYVDEAVLRFYVKVSPNVPQTIFTDKTRLLRILCHLGLNSLKYTQRGFVLLTINFDTKKEHIVFTLLDTGVGMSPQRAKTIEEFIGSEFLEVAPRNYAEDPEDYGSFGNIMADNLSVIDISETGLGLYITGKLCEKFGSKLVIKGMEGHGASFSFSVHSPIKKYLTVVQYQKNIKVDETKTPEMKVDNILEDRKEGQHTGRVDDELSVSESLAEIADELPEITEKEEEEIKGAPVEGTKRASFKKLKQKSASLRSIYTVKNKPITFDSNKELKRVLVVDDQQVNRLVVKEMLKKIAEFRVDEASNGKEAVNLWETMRYDIIFMDLDMPVMNGFEAVQRIREWEENGPEAGVHVPILAVTAYDTPEIISQSVFAGFDELLIKPVTFSRMRTCMNRYCSAGP